MFYAANVPEVPSIASCLGLLFFVVIVILGFYSIFNNASPSFTYYQRLILPVSFKESLPMYQWSRDDTDKKEKFDIIMQKSKIHLSIVTCVKNAGERAGVLVDKLLEYFDNVDFMRGKEYEIIVVDNGSSDDTIDILYKRALDHPNILILKMDEPGPREKAIVTGILHARGDRILHFFPFFALKITEFSQMYDKLDEMMTSKPRSVVIGLWKFNDTIERSLSTTLSRTITKVSKFLFDKFNVDATILSYSHCFMYSRDAAACIFPNIYSHGEGLDVEITAMAGLSYCSICSVENELIIPSNLRMEGIDRSIEFFYLARFYFVYVTGIHQIKFFTYQK